MGGGGGGGGDWGYNDDNNNERSGANNALKHGVRDETSASVRFEVGWWVRALKIRFDPWLERRLVSTRYYHVEDRSNKNGFK